MVIIDAQVHIWGADTPERPWPSGGASHAHRPTPLSKDELLREMDAAGVDRVVIVPPSWEGDRGAGLSLRRRQRPDHGPGPRRMVGMAAAERPLNRGNP
jgi:predicted TIM-barrel fold metal-dependent hydrolase